MAQLNFDSYIILRFYNACDKTRFVHETLLFNSLGILQIGWTYTFHSFPKLPNDDIKQNGKQHETLPTSKTVVQRIRSHDNRSLVKNVHSNNMVKDLLIFFKYTIILIRYIFNINISIQKFCIRNQSRERYTVFKVKLL